LPADFICQSVPGIFPGELTVKTLPYPRALRAGLIVVAALVVASCSTADAGDPERLARLSQQLPPMSTESQEVSTCPASAGPANTLRLEGAQGESLRLAYFAGCGWKYLAVNREGVAAAGFSHTSFASRRAPDGSVLATREDPMTVFIDGPTGYTFAWTAESGWKFVGQLRP
jgi:hypothetical protein